MARPSIYTAAKAIEAEFDEPLRDVIRGFFIQGHTIRSVAQVLEVSPASVARYINRANLRVPSPARSAARRRRPRTDPAVTSRAMRRAARRKIAFAGKVLSFADWETVTGIPRDAIRMRINRGWSVDRALTDPLLTNGIRYPGIQADPRLQNRRPPTAQTRHV